MKHWTTTTRLRSRVAVFAAGAVTGLLCVNAAAVTGYRPSDPSHVVVRLGESGRESELARLRSESLKAPDDVEALKRYTQGLIAMGATTGDERYYGFAERSVNTASAAMEPRLALLKAQLLQHRHEFRGAEQILSRLIASEPRNFDALLTRAQVHIHLHEPEKAAQDCARLMLKVDLLTSTTCMAQARAAMSADSVDLERAYDLLAAVLQNATGRATTRSWNAGIAAEMAARLLKQDAAEHWYRAAYDLDPNSHYARLIYADWLLAQGRAHEAHEVASHGVSNADTLRLILSTKAIDSHQARQLQLSWKEAARRGEHSHLRDQARFELIVLNDTARAHATALDNFKEQREPDDALILAQTAAAQRDMRALTLIKEWQRARRYADRRLDNLLAERP